VIQHRDAHLLYESVTALFSQTSAAQGSSLERTLSIISALLSLLRRTLPPFSSPKTESLRKDVLQHDIENTPSVTPLIMIATFSTSSAQLESLPPLRSMRSKVDILNPTDDSSHNEERCDFPHHNFPLDDEYLRRSVILKSEPGPRMPSIQQRDRTRNA
jgi:hypothetical protein